MGDREEPSCRPGDAASVLLSTPPWEAEEVVVTGRSFVGTAVAVAVAASVPAVADGVVRFARNAGRADDLDAGQGPLPRLE